MTANELADLIENEDTLWLEPHLDAIANMLRQQKDRINVLEANHKIQLKINKKALEYIKKLEKENENLKERDRVNSLLFNQVF
jgi:hypothetical protein